MPVSTREILDWPTKDIGALARIGLDATAARLAMVAMVTSVAFSQTEVFRFEMVLLNLIRSRTLDYTFLEVLRFVDGKSPWLYSGLTLAVNLEGRGDEWLVRTCIGMDGDLRGILASLLLRNRTRIRVELDGFVRTGALILLGSNASGLVFRHESAGRCAVTLQNQDRDTTLGICEESEVMSSLLSGLLEHVSASPVAAQEENHLIFAFAESAFSLVARDANSVLRIAACDAAGGERGVVELSWTERIEWFALLELCRNRAASFGHA